MIQSPKSPNTKAPPARWRHLAERPVPPRVVVGTLILSALIFGASSWLPRLAEAPLVASSVSPRSAVVPNADDLLELRIADLARKSSAFRSGRNIFTHGDPTAADSNRREHKDRKRDQDADRGRSRHELPAAKPSLNVTLLGVFGPSWRRIAVLEHLDGSGISNVLEEDVVEGRYRVQKIDLQSVRLRHTDKPESSAIRLSFGKEPEVL